jgi:hypothetical protein
MPRIPALPDFAATVASDDELPLYDTSEDTTYGVTVAQIATAVQTITTGVSEAPNDGVLYARQSEDWTAIYQRATVETVSGTTQTPATGTDGRYFVCTNAAGCAVTIPPNSAQAFPVGTMLTYQQDGAAAVTFTAGSGVTLRVPASYQASSAEQYAVVQVCKAATNTWTLYGHLLIA